MESISNVSRQVICQAKFENTVEYIDVIMCDSFQFQVTWDMGMGCYLLVLIFISLYVELRMIKHHFFSILFGSNLEH